MTSPSEKERQGSTESVEGSGKSNKSEASTFIKPAKADASNEIPSSNAFFNALGVIEIFFCVPKISQKARRINLISFSETKFIISFFVIFIFNLL